MHAGFGVVRLGRGFCLLQTFFQMRNALFGSFVDLHFHIACFWAVRGEVQLGPWLGPSRQTLIQFGFCGYAGGCSAKRLCVAQRS